MPTPFPGMDPYLEHPTLWPNVHVSLMTSIRDALLPLLRPRYFVSVEERVYTQVSGLTFFSEPDVHVLDLRASREPGTAYAMAAGGSMTVELPMPEERRETFLQSWFLARAKW